MQCATYMLCEQSSAFSLTHAKNGWEAQLSQQQQAWSHHAAPPSYEDFRCFSNRREKEAFSLGVYFGSTLSAWNACSAEQNIQY